MILPKETIARRGSLSWAQGSLIWDGEEQAWALSQQEASRDVQEPSLVIIAPSPWSPPHQGPSLGLCFSELCLLSQRLKIKLCGVFYSISLVNASKKKLNLSDSMWLVSCLHCMPWAGQGLYLVESGCICKSLLPSSVALLGSVFSCCWDKLTSPNIDAF